jgi:hypothetical protein
MQSGTPIPPSYARVLSILNEALAGMSSPWAITGSLGMALQGLPLAVHDIDLQTDAVGAYEIERRLASFSLTPECFSESERIRSHLGALEIGGVRVEIMGALQKRLPDGTWEPPVAVEKHRVWVLWQGMRLPVLDLAYEAEAYARLGRTERATMLRRWLEEHHGTRHG